MSNNQQRKKVYQIILGFALHCRTIMLLLSSHYFFYTMLQLHFISLYIKWNYEYFIFSPRDSSLLTNHRGQKV